MALTVIWGLVRDRDPVSGALQWPWFVGRLIFVPVFVVFISWVWAKTFGRRATQESEDS